MKYTAILLVAGLAYGQHHFGGSFQSGQYKGGIQTLQSSPLPPHGYVSPSVLRKELEPPKPFAYKYEGPDPYGGYSSHESQGDEQGRVTGQYTVQNPDGTSRVVKYVADPEYGFHAEIDTDEEGTKTSEPANALIRSSASEERYIPQVKKSPYNAPVPAPYGVTSANKAASLYKAPAYKAPAPYARQAAHKAPPSYGTSLGGYQAQPQYRASGAYGDRATYRASTAYKAAASRRSPTAYRNTSKYRVPTAYRTAPQYGATGAYKTPASYQGLTAYRTPAGVPASYSHRQPIAYGKRPYY
ncbi:cuticle protein 16.8-like [Tropilaelaps mercedesae]|uniref:Cuticle protein 16.8-like n=1 Tax=Tropilaelaps mercedesae TaxID=418985 RepID=A0A1V9Y2N2_9ACAR|nr:cuticle protein 16.8-like [Tropilaelaps mercedesae]